jgi:hypothetical protein
MNTDFFQMNEDVRLLVSCIVINLQYRTWPYRLLVGF